MSITQTPANLKLPLMSDHKGFIHDECGPVAQVFDNIGEERWEELAALFCAAPDLLIALKDCLRFVDNQPGVSDEKMAKFGTVEENKRRLSFNRGLAAINRAAGKDPQP